MIRLARHGQTAYNAERRFQGQSSVPLDERGREQARALAERCAAEGFDALVSSPLERARETAAIVGARLRLEAAEDARWAETDCGDWTHRTFDEVIAEDPEGFAAFQRVDPGFAFPGGESFAEHQARVAAAAQDLRASAGDTRTLVVCHRNSIRLALVAMHGDEDARTRELPNTTLVTL
jgi:broad specificity phosphatase PhoE